MTCRRALMALVLPAVLVTCSGDLPAGAGGPGFATLALRVEAPPSLAQFAPGLAVEQVKARVLRGLGRAVVDTLATRTAPFSVNSNTLNLSLSVLLGEAAETLTVELEYLSAAGRLLWFASQSVVARAGSASSPPPLVPSYAGPGGNVAFITITPGSGTVVAGNTLPFAISALDGQQLPVNPESVYVSWSATGGTVNAHGVFQAANATGQVRIAAQTPNLIADSVTVTVLAAGASALTGLVLDGATQAALPNATVEVRDATDAIVATVTSGSDGSFATPPLNPGVYRVVVSLNGFVTATLFDALLGGGGSTTVPPIPMAPVSAQLGDITGQVLDATTTLRIPGAFVELRDGVNATTGTPLAFATTDTGGAYSFVRFPAGTYTVTASNTGFTAASRTSVVLGGLTSTGQDVNMSPIGSEEVRVVLTWGAAPFDLDAHLTGPSTLGGRFHVYYVLRGSLTGDPFAFLDVDDTDSFGPETITIASQASGVYRFSVHDFSNAGLNPSTALAGSGARVDLYLAGTLTRSFFVPNQPGTLWTVFTLNGTAVTTVNSMSYATDSDAITIRDPGGRLESDGALIGREVGRHKKP